jgi:hypothetical protein
MVSHPRTLFEVTTLRTSNLTNLNFFSAIRMSSSFASSEGDEDELDIDSDKEGDEGTTKIGKYGKELMCCEIGICLNTSMTDISFLLYKIILIMLLFGNLFNYYNNQ